MKAVLYVLSLLILSSLIYVYIAKDFYSGKRSKPDASVAIANAGSKKSSGLFGLGEGKSKTTPKGYYMPSYINYAEYTEEELNGSYDDTLFDDVTSIPKAPINKAPAITQNVAPAPSPVAPAPVVTRNYTPSTERLPSSAKNVIAWGIITHTASLYDTEGAILKTKLPGGAIVELTGLKETSRGNVGLCNLYFKGAWQGPYLVALSDMLRFEGNREEVDAENVTKLMKYFSASGKYEARCKELDQKALERNPYYKEYAPKAKSHNALIDDATRLKKLRDAATGDKKAAYNRQLNALNIQISRNADAFLALKKKYDEWEKSNGNVKVNYDADSQCREYKQIMDALRADVSALGVK